MLPNFWSIQVFTNAEDFCMGFIMVINTVDDLIIAEYQIQERLVVFSRNFLRLLQSYLIYTWKWTEYDCSRRFYSDGRTWSFNKHMQNFYTNRCSTWQWMTYGWTGCFLIIYSRLSTFKKEMKVDNCNFVVSLLLIAV